MRDNRLLFRGLGLIAASAIGMVAGATGAPNAGFGWAGPFGGMMGGGAGGYGGTMAPFVASNLPPLAPEAAKSAAERYLARLGNAGLAIREVMVFSNNAYVSVVEKGSGMGAFELLVDPRGQSVGPEPGPNMMWNVKYSPMAGMGGMMGGVKAGSGEMIGASQATQAAQRYLDANLPGAKAAEDAQRFYGYYTLDIERDGRPAGMLSVNGYTQAVFVHHWHGTFVSETRSG